VTQEQDFRLADEHLDRAKEIAQAHCRRSACRVCFGRGWEGVGLDNTIVLCRKCVDQEAAMKDWKEYVREIPELWAYYREMYEQQESGSETGEQA